MSAHEKEGLAAHEHGGKHQAKKELQEFREIGKVHTRAMKNSEVPRVFTRNRVRDQH